MVTLALSGPLILYNRIAERCAMPRGKSSNGKGTKVESVWGGFIDLRLNDDERAEFESFAANFQWSELEDCIGDDLKLGLSFDSVTGTYLATFTSDKHAGQNLRCVLTARADDWQRAVVLVIFKHLRLLEGDWGRYKPSTQRGSEV